MGDPGWSSTFRLLLDTARRGSKKAPNSQSPSSQKSTKLQAQKPTCAPFAPASGLRIWNFLWSLGLGTWCFVQKAAPKLSCARGRCAPKRTLDTPLNRRIVSPLNPNARRILPLESRMLRLTVERPSAFVQRRRKVFSLTQNLNVCFCKRAYENSFHPAWEPARAQRPVGFHLD